MVALLVVACGKDDTTTTPNPTGGGNAQTATKLIQDEFDGLPLVIVGSSSANYMLAFERELPDGSMLQFEALNQAYPAIMGDQEGNRWNVFGRAISGPRKGQQLKPAHSYIGFWFAWGTMYPGVELYEGPAYSGDFRQEEPAEDWTIPTANVFSSVGLDGIPAVDEPVFETFNNRDAIENGYFVEDDELVIGIQMNDEIHLYPHSILNWHEIVNDQLGSTYFAMSFCPLTGTAIAWNRELDEGVTTFGVSGLLYNSNVMPYDRLTTSVWSQMREDCVRGDLIGRNWTTYPVVETTWATWKRLLDSPNVLTRATGFNKDYDTNPYQDYISDNNFLAFPIEFMDDRVPSKERVLGVIVNGKAKVYRFQDFQ